MKKLLIFLMILIPLVVIFIVNVTVDIVAGVITISVDSVISVVDDRHLDWGYDENTKRYFPRYSQRDKKL